MSRRITALLLTLTLLLAALSTALASESRSVSTPLSGDDAKLENLRLAAQAIDGTRIPSGGRFSFNDAVGPRTRRRGYKKAPNGRGVPVTGGGVAQAASTLYLALLKLGNGVSIDPVKTYGSRFTDDYVDDPDYAIITDYDAGIDLSFTNRGDALSIDMWLGDDALWCVVTVGGEDFGFDSAIASASNGGGLFLSPTEAPTPARALLGSAELDCGDDGDVLHNIALAADCVDDTALEGGDTFSFNDVVGPRTQKYGYRRAVNGRGVKVTGGGVAQLASALWLAVKDMDDIAIVEKSTYGDKYNQHYVRSSADAILTDYSSGRDFAFRYTGSGSVTLYTYLQDGRLRVEIYEN